MNDRKDLCKECAQCEEQPFFLSGLGTNCEQCGKSAFGEYEKRDGKWRSFAVYRGYA